VEEPTIAEAEAEAVETAEEFTPTPAPTQMPTPAPLESAWPLSSDLFYLDETGQIWRQPMLGDETTVMPITSADAAVRDFAVAPGGNWLIYRTVESVTITSLDGKQGRIISQIEPDSSFDLNILPGTDQHTVAWSPDAGKLAYVTSQGFEVLIPGAGDHDESLIYPVEEEPLSLLSWSRDSSWLLVSRADGSYALYSTDPLVRWVELGQLNGFAWLDDGRLAFAPVEGGLAVLTPGDVDSRVFVTPQDRQVTLPGQRPDGTLVYFVHSGTTAEPGFLHAANPDELSFRVESNAPVETGGLIWDPVSRYLIALDAERQSFTIVDPSSGSSASFETAGAVATFDWGDAPPQAAAGLAMKDDLYFLASQAGAMQVWRLPASGDPPQPITNTPGGVTGFDISPDGTQVVYASENAIWRAVINTLDVTQIAGLSSPEAMLSTAPTFSPSGREIAFADQGIWVHNLDTGETGQIIADRTEQTYDQPRWSPDGKWLLLRVGFAEGDDQAIMPIEQVGDPILLDYFSAQAEWIDEQTICVYSDGSFYGGPFMSLVKVSEIPTFKRLAVVPVIDAQLQPDGRLAFLQVPIPGVGGPTIVRVGDILLSGSDVRVDPKGHVLELARLSPDTTYIAGIVQPRVENDGSLSGRLAIINLQDDTIVMIEGVSGVRDLHWAE
jgi:dipeptidyl aminopeptidase/acylaminoacyl peptidase